MPYRTIFRVYRFQLRFASLTAGLVLIATSLQMTSAQEQQSPFVLRVLELDASGRYTCTALTADHQLEQLTVFTYHGSPPPSELRRGAATDEDMRRAEELLEQPEFRGAASEQPHFPKFVIRRDGKFIMVIGHVNGTPKLVQFSDPEGKKTIPKYFKGFEAFTRDVRRRKLPKPPGKGTPHCQITTE